jgi:uncharacterized protein YndB with AHSA1/START domain
MTHHVQFEQWVPAPVERVFLFFANPENLPRIMPPDTGARLVELKLAPPPGNLLDPTGASGRNPVAGPGSEIVTCFA